MNKFDIEKVELKICKLYTNEFEEFHFPRNLTGINHDQEDILRLKKYLQDSIPGNRKKDQSVSCEKGNQSSAI